jgi:hypothetical protein
MTIRVLAAVCFGLSAAACSYSETTTGPVPATTVAVPPPVVSVAPAPVATVYTPPPSVTVVPAAPSAPVGVEAFRDEYGFRYDGRGNRLDRYGNIISPQSTTP